ncbi:MAG TPA: AraC family ligand binding domain-containing protein [Bryobacteraceae bacterium]
MTARGPVPLNRPTAPLGVQNAVLRARARTHSVKEFPGPLSIKSVTEGAVAWKVSGRDLLVDPGSFLVLNQDEPYSMEIDSRTPVATLCVFFQRGFVDSVAGSLTSEEIEPGGGSAPLLPRLHAADGSILPRMRAIAEARDACGLWLDEQFLGLAQDLVLLDRGARRRVQTLPARRRATREELFRRV